MAASNKPLTDPRPISTKIKRKSPPALRYSELAVEFTGTVCRRICHLREPLRDSISPVNTLSCLLALVHELLEPIISTPPHVPPGLAGGHALGEPIKVAAPEGLNTPRLVNTNEIWFEGFAIVIEALSFCRY